MLQRRRGVVFLESRPCKEWIVIMRGVCRILSSAPLVSISILYALVVLLLFPKDIDLFLLSSISFFEMGCT